MDSFHRFLFVWCVCVCVEQEASKELMSVVSDEKRDANERLVVVAANLRHGPS